MSALKQWVSFGALACTSNARPLLTLWTLHARREPPYTCAAKRVFQRLACLRATRRIAWTWKSCQAIARNSLAAQLIVPCEFAPMLPSQPEMILQAAFHVHSNYAQSRVCAPSFAEVARSSQYRSESRWHCVSRYILNHAAPRSSTGPPQHLHARSHCHELSLSFFQPSGLELLTK